MAQGLDPHLDWSTPAPIAYPTPLNTTDQLNATASVPGTFTYDPAAGAVLSPGYHKLRVTFTPTDSTYYQTNSSVDLWVNLATPASTVTLDQTSSGLTVSYGSDSQAHFAAFDDTGRVFMTKIAGHGISVFDSATLNAVAPVLLPGSTVTDLAIDNGGHRLFAADSVGVRVIDTASLTLIDTIIFSNDRQGAKVLAYDPGTNLLFAMNVDQLNSASWAIDLSKAPTDPNRIANGLLDTSSATALVADPTSHTIYVPNPTFSTVDLVEGDPAKPGFLALLSSVPVRASSFGHLSVAVNRRTHRAYVGADETGVQVIDGDPASATFGTLVDTISDVGDMSEVYGTGQNPGFWGHDVDIDADLDRAYVWLSNFWGGDWDELAVVDLTTKSLLSLLHVVPSMTPDGEGATRIQVDPYAHRLFVFDPADFIIRVFRDEIQATGITAPAGAQPVSVSAPGVNITFSSVAAAGDTTVQVVQQGALNLSLPGVFSLEGAGFEVSTSASAIPPFTLCFDASSVTSASAFASLHVLHGEAGSWVDRTTSRDYATGTVCASVDSFSPFVVARQNAPEYAVVALYDQSKANKRGSTVPIRIRVNNSDGSNASSASLAVTVTAVTRTSDQAAGAYTDPGNANPDNDFRFDSGLAGYIYNLKTTSLTAGTYSVTFRIGFDSTSYSVTFQVR